MTIKNKLITSSSGLSTSAKALSYLNFRNIVGGMYSNLKGMERGALAAGFMPVFSTDVSEFAEVVHRTEHPVEQSEVFLRKDVQDLTAKDVAVKLKTIGLDLSQLEMACLVGGPPCFGLTSQSINSRSMFHPLNMLMIEFVRMVRELRPLTAWMEQVDALMDEPMKDFREFLFTHLDALEGYNWKIEVLNAAEFGCFQSRLRTTLVIIRDDVGKASLPKPRAIDLSKQSAHTVIGAEKFRSTQFDHKPKNGHENVFQTLTSGDYEVYRNNRWGKITLEDRIKLAQMEGIKLSGVSKTRLVKMLGMMVIPPFAEAVMGHIRGILEQAGKFVG